MSDWKRGPRAARVRWASDDKNEIAVLGASSISVSASFARVSPEEVTQHVNVRSLIDTHLKVEVESELLSNEIQYAAKPARGSTSGVRWNYDRTFLDREEETDTAVIVGDVRAGEKVLMKVWVSEVETPGAVRWPGRKTYKI